MFQLIRSLSRQQLFAQQTPILAVSIVIAELFYKFHSFTLECVAFLVTWFALDAITQGALFLWKGTRAGLTQPPRRRMGAVCWAIRTGPISLAELSLARTRCRRQFLQDSRRIVMLSTFVAG